MIGSLSGSGGGFFLEGFVESSGEATKSPQELVDHFLWQFLSGAKDVLFSPSMMKMFGTVAGLLVLCAVARLIILGRFDVFVGMWRFIKPRGMGGRERLFCPRRRIAYGRQEFLLSPAESAFYLTLQQTPFTMYKLIFVKVRVADVLTCPEKDRQVAFNRISQKHIDFIVCDAQFKVLLAIELDDRSHLMEKRIRADQSKNEALGSAGIPLVRVKVQSGYNTHMLNQQFLSAVVPVMLNRQLECVNSVANLNKPETGPDARYAPPGYFESER